MAVITMLLTAPWLKLEQAGGQRGSVRHPRDHSSSQLYIDIAVLLASPCDTMEIQVLVPTDER